MFESRISAGGTEKLPYSENLSISPWSCDMEGHAKKCVERYCELANKTTQQLYKVSTPWIDGPPLERGTFEICRRIVKSMLSNCSEMPLLGTYWKTRYSMVSEQTCTIDYEMDQILWQTIESFWYLTSITYVTTKQHCHVGNPAKQCRLGLFQDSDFAGDLEDSKSTSGGTLCVFGSHRFVPISWMCKKQTSVSHSSTESEIISLDAALDLWDLIVSVLGNTTQNRIERGDPLPHTIYKRKQSQRMINDLDNVDFLPSNVQSCQEALLYVFEDNEAVIKMIIKGRSPTKRHVSRTHRVALDWLFDRINLDSKIQIKYIDTTNQLADILTKGNFTRDEWESSFVFV